VLNVRFQGATSNVPPAVSCDIQIEAATVTLHDYIDFYRNSRYAIIATNSGKLVVGEWFTLITTNSVTFYGFCLAATLSSLSFSPTGVGFAGTANGIRYTGLYNSVIYTGGAGPNRLPGNVAGSVDASSVYI
jgi:hypothetical protein